LGTPDSTKTGDVRKYLREFLMDGRVIDFPFIPRWMLVNLIIAPFRSPKSAGEYRKLWTDRGSPLLFHTQDLKDKLVKKLDPEKTKEYNKRAYEKRKAKKMEEPTL
jgi:ferrochelatase